MNIFDMSGVERWNRMLAKDRATMYPAERCEWLGMFLAGLMNAANDGRWTPGTIVMHVPTGEHVTITECLPLMRDGPLYSVRARGPNFLVHPFRLRSL